MNSEEDRFWNSKWSDICGVCGGYMENSFTNFEIKITKAWEQWEEVFFMTQVCDEDCTDNAFEMLAKGSPRFKRFYKFKSDVPAGGSDAPEFLCGNCGAVIRPLDRRILVYGFGPYHEAYIELNQMYCSYKCYKDGIRLGRDYVSTVMKEYGRPAL